jgi:putative ABC transport system permease protein
MHRKLRNVYILFKLLGESFSFAYTSVKANKLRTFLSLLGITIGIFSIISIYTMVDALEANVRLGLESFGSNVIYIQRFPWTMEEEDGGVYKWWEFRQRPSIKYEDFTYIRNHCTTADAVAFAFGFGRELKYKNNTTSRVSIAATSYDWDKTSAFEINTGRYFSPMEMNSGVNVALLGHTTAEELFGTEDPVGKYFQIAGRKTRVIGVLEKQGKSILSAMDYDNLVLIPYNYGKSMANVRYGDPFITLKARPNTSVEEMKGELKIIMRSLRRLKPSQKDNFALNELSSISKELNPIMDTINFTGTIIGLLAILIGAFGVANIMFVSVKERTHIIGIQKSLGAKNYFILTQFLFESILLTIAGGVLGLIIIFMVTTAITHLMDFPISLTLPNILIGLLISATVGIFSGIIPAYTASRLDPVVAISAK